MKLLLIHSENHWTNGWFFRPDLISSAIEALSAYGLQVQQASVSHVDELSKVLDQVPQGTLLWPNAYYVDAPATHGLVWMQDMIEARGLPYLGNGAESLKMMLNKVATYQSLKAGDVPIPKFLWVKRGQPIELAAELSKAGLTFPLATKPTHESCSLGIKKVTHLAEAQAHLAHLMANFPNSDVLFEEFLPSEDITCGYLQVRGQIMLLPTYYSSTLRSGKDHMVERDLGLPPWGGSCITMPPVTQDHILQQITDSIPKLVDALKISGVTRADARLNAKGQLCYFDINGMPAMGFPKSVLVRQVRECIPSIEPLKAYAYLLNTLVLMASDRFGLAAPSKLEQHTLFSLDAAKHLHFKA